MSVEAESRAHPAMQPWRRSLVTPVIEARVLPFLFLPAAVLACWMLAIRHFDGLYGQDPYAYLGYAVGPLRASLLHGSALTSSFVPLGYPFAAAVASLVVGPSATAGQIVSVLAAVLAVIFCYLLGRDGLRLLGVEAYEARSAALIGSLLLATAGYFLELGVTDMSDAVALAGTVGSAWALVRWIDSYRSQPKLGWLAVSSAGLAYAIVSWWGDGILALVWLLATVPILLVSPWRGRMQIVAAGVTPALLVIGVQLYWAFTVPRGDVRPFAFLGNFSLQGDSWTLTNLFQHSFHNSDGYLQYHLPNVLFYLSEPFRTAFLTPLFALPLLLALLELGSRARRHFFGRETREILFQAPGLPAIFVLLAGWPAALLLFDSGLPWQDPRWVLAALPPIALLAGLGCVRLRQLLPRRLRVLFLPAMAIGILAITLGAERELARIASVRQQEISTIAWLQTRLPVRSTVLTTEITPGIQFRTDQRAIELYGLSPARLHSLVTTTRRLYLLVNLRPVTTQFAALDPGRDYRYLASSRLLRYAGINGGYTLFAVRFPQGPIG